MIMNGQTVTTPSMAYPISPSVFGQNISDYSFGSKYFNTAGVNITFSTTASSFTKNGGACTLVDYWGVNLAAVQEYDQKNCNFYVGSFLPAGNVPNGTVFNYEIVNNSS